MFRSILNFVTIIILGFLLISCNSGVANNSANSMQNSNLADISPNQIAKTHSKTYSTDEYAYIIDGKTNKIRMYRVDPTGKLIEFGTLGGASGTSFITISPNNKFAYVPSSGSKNIEVFSINQSSGQLTPIQSAKLPTTGSERLVITPDGKHAYSSSLYCTTNTNVIDNCINEFSVDPSTGYLTYIANVNANITGSINGLITIDKSGKYVYITSSNFNSTNAVELFKVDSATGLLNAVAYYPAENCTGGWSLKVSNNNTLYATFYSTNGLNNVYAYKINPMDGSLSVLSTTNGGDYPASIISTRDNKFVYFTTLGTPANIYMSSASQDGSLSLLSPSTIPTHDITTIALNTTSSRLYGLDYSSGSYSIFDVSNTGQLIPTFGPITIHNSNSSGDDIVFVRFPEGPFMLQPPVGARTNVPESTVILLQIPSNVNISTLNSSTIHVTQTINQAQESISTEVLYNLSMYSLNQIFYVKLTPKKNLEASAKVNVSFSGVKYNDGSPVVDRQWAFATTRVVNNIPDVTMVAVNSSNLPALQQPTVAVSGDYWLIISGMTGTFHGFSGTNPNIYVYKPSTGEVYSESIVNTDLPEAVQHQITSVAPNTLKEGNTLYMIGGYYNTSAEYNTYVTLDTVTSYNISGMVNAIIKNDPHLAQFVHYTSEPQFKVTGGQLGKIDASFYLAFGQDCESYYCGASQVYTNSIYKFKMEPNLSHIAIESSISQPDLGDSGFRRRDYNLVPIESSNGKPILFALGGPFTPGNDAYVWTNGIIFDKNLAYNNHFINQQANQYSSGKFGIYSRLQGTSYAVTFSGLSNTYWGESGLVYDNTTPYGNILDVISYDSSGTVQEYANITPVCGVGTTLANCLYIGLDATFVPNRKFFNSRNQLMLDELSSGPTLVGYLYGGLTSPTQSVFNAGTLTNQVYAIYITPNTTSSSWVNITNRHGGIQ